MDLYKKHPLSHEGQIRLLQIAKWSEASPDVTCDLTVVNLSGGPEFCALSYTWGLPFPRYVEETLAAGLSASTGYQRQDETEPENTAIQLERKTDVKIFCNGTNTTVGSNLHDFLIHCSKSSDPDLCGPIWIDALCIDQSNLSERGHQVQIMSDIYKAASKVIVWLGIENRSTNLAAELIRALAGASPAERSQRARPSHLSPGNKDILSNSDHWNALAQFFERNWFGRAWIIQEVTFAQEVVILCGSYTLQWAELTIASQFIAASSWTEFFNEAACTRSTEGVSVRRQNIPAKLAATRKTWLSSSSNGLLYALIRSRASSCEDPRDKVYSQLRLGNADIFPSYKLSVADVYIKAAKHILEHTDNLLLLTSAEGPDFHAVPDLPSWVPDWSVTKDLGLRATGYASFNADLNIKRNFEVKNIDGKHILNLDAMRIDSIAKAGATKEELQDFSRLEGF